jgi:hypothetical protein
LGRDHAYVRRHLKVGKEKFGVEPSWNIGATAAPGRLTHEIYDGVCVVGSDAHYWPGVASTAHRAFVRFCERLCPTLVVINGDAFDGASVSRHSPLIWEEKPPVIGEIEACVDRLGEIAKAAPKARKAKPLGNHDSRFESRLATVAPEYAKVKGFHLKDHIPEWEPCWSIWVNNVVAIKHRLKGGVHARHNNTVAAGMTTVTGHLHNLGVTPFNDYRGCRWGVDTGMMAEPFGPQFEYLEDGPRNWRSGFVILTFRAGKLMWPEVVHVLEPGVVEFRGERIEV